MERDVGEYIVDPWVIDRHTLVGIDADRVVAAAHVKRYGIDERVTTRYRDAADVSWIICDPASPAAGADVLDAAMACMRLWGVRIWYADGSLPCLGVYGVPNAWPHVEGLLIDAGFDDDGGRRGLKCSAARHVTARAPS